MSEELPADLLTIEAAAAKLGVARRVLHRWRLAHRLTCWRIFGRWKVSWSALLAVAVKRQGPEDAPMPQPRRLTRAQEDAACDARLRARGHRV